MKPGLGTQRRAGALHIARVQIDDDVDSAPLAHAFRNMHVAQPRLDDQAGLPRNSDPAAAR